MNAQVQRDEPVLMMQTQEGLKSSLIDTEEVKQSFHRSTKTHTSPDLNKANKNDIDYLNVVMSASIGD